MFKFEFDENKSKANLKKHGVSFEEAIGCFNDSQSIEFYDEAHSTDEDRFILLGNSNQGRVLMVAYTIRDNMKVISSSAWCELRFCNVGGVGLSFCFVCVCASTVRALRVIL